MQQFTDLQTRSAGIFGFYAKHIETNQSLAFNKAERFLMCSTYKIPVAILFLHLVEQKKIALDELYTITQYDLRPGADFTLNKLDYESPQKVALKTILTLMMQESCNTSTDIILRLIGGPKKVNEFLQQINITDMRIDRSTKEVLAEWEGIENIPEQCTLAEFQSLEQAVPQEKLLAARTLFKTRDQDSTTPEAMTTLLCRLFARELLPEAATEFLLTIMRACRTGANRLKGLLPADTPIAHKTGTLTGYVCDAGIITLPAQAGHVAIAAFIKDSTNKEADNEAVLADLGRQVYDYFTLSHD